MNGGVLWGRSRPGRGCGAIYGMEILFRILCMTVAAVVVRGSYLASDKAEVQNRLWEVTVIRRRIN